MIAINAGSLDRRITIQRATYATSSLNTPIATWADLTTVWANITFRNAGEGEAGQQVRATLQTRFTIRYSSKVADVNPKDRLTFDGRTYDIKAVYELGRRQGMEIHAVARSD